MRSSLRSRAAAVVLLVVCAHTDAFARVNKYAKFSKAEEVRKSLRFSNIGDVDSNSSTPAAEPAAPPPPRASWAYPDAAQVDQRDPTTFGFTEIGVVLGAHGTRGELKVSSDSDFAQERLCKPGRTWLRRKRRRAPREERIVRGRKGPGTNNFLVTLDSVANREEAAAMRGSTLFVRRELRPELQSDEMMLWELEGLSVVLAERAPPLDDGDAVEQAAADADDAVRWTAGARVGTVSGVVPREELTGSRTLGNDLLEVTLAAASGEEAEQEDEDAEEADGDDTVLVPFVPQIVVDVRLDEGLVLIDPPAGLLAIVQPKRVERVVIRGLLPDRAASLQESSDREIG